MAQMQISQKGVEVFKFFVFSGLNSTDDLFVLLHGASVMVHTNMIEPIIGRQIWPRVTTLTMFSQRGRLLR